jgi:hypothetical protein
MHGEVVKGSGSYEPIVLDSDHRQLVVLAARSGRSSSVVTASGDLKGSAGTLHGLVIAYTGVTAGDTVLVKDGGSGGTLKVPVVLGAAQGTLVLEDLDMTFATSIYAELTLTGGTCYVLGIYS